MASEYQKVVIVAVDEVKKEVSIYGDLPLDSKECLPMLLLVKEGIRDARNTTYNVLAPKTATMTYASFATKLFKTSHDEYEYSISAALITNTILA